MFDWIQFEPLQSISSDGPLRGPLGPMGALRSSSGPSDDDVTWPMSLPVEFCSIGFNLNPFGTSVPTGPFGALRAPWGPCGPFRGPLMTMLDWIQFEPLRSISSDGPLRGPSGPMGALRTPSGPSDDDVTWPMSLPVEFCSIGFNLNPFGTSVPTGPFGALRAPWGPCGPLGPAGPFGPHGGPAGPFGALS